MGLFGGGNSTQSTTNLSQTQTQDRRVVADGGSSVVNADSSNVTLNSFTTQSDQGAIAGGLAAATQASLYGAQTAQYALGTIGNSLSDITGASNHLNDIGLSMLQGSNALANSLSQGSNNLVTHVLDVAGGLYRDAASNNTQVVGIAQDLAKTQVAAQNDNRYIIAAALAVVCIVGVMAFKGKA